MNEPESSTPGQNCADFIQRLIERAALIRIPSLLLDRAGVLYRVDSRQGVSCIALRTIDLTEEELIAILTYRLAQYAAISFVNHELIQKERMQHEPLANVRGDEVHVIALSSDSYEILSYACYKGKISAPPATRMLDRNRDLFPVEVICGRGVFDRLSILPDLPTNKVREMGRLMKNHIRSPLDPQAARATVEVTCGLFHLAVGPLRNEMDAVVGDIEEGVASRNMEFLQVPFVLFHGVVPYLPEDAYSQLHIASSNICPFAILVSDLYSATDRVAQVEKALSLPGKKGITALLTLKADAKRRRSSLEPRDGVPALTDVHVRQKDVSMQARRERLEQGAWLRSVPLFAGLSVSEAAILGTFMERLGIPAGEAVIREGDAGDDIYLIESGEAEVWRRQGGRSHQIIRLGPGQYFGEISLITGARRTADVVASTDLKLMRLGKEDYLRYLRHLIDIEAQLSQAAARRSIPSSRVNNKEQ
jgi:hypothetical protein